MKHTPGKWIIKGDRTAMAIRGNGYTVATIIRTSKASPEEKAANARLIAAAPELLEALKIALHRADQARYHTAEELGPITAEWLDGIITYARAAIAKATDDTETARAAYFDAGQPF